MGARLFGRRLSVPKMAEGIAFRDRQVDCPLINKRMPPEIDLEAALAWFVIVTAPRSENKAEKALQELRFTAYFPREIYRTRRRANNRLIRAEVQKPLIPRYLFLGVAPDNNWYKLREVGYIAGILSNNGMPSQIPAHEVKRLADLEREGWFDEGRKPQLGDVVTRPLFRSGDQVLIGGENPLSGLVGLVRAATPRQRVEVLVTFFGRLTPVIIPIKNVKLVERAASRS